MDAFIIKISRETLYLTLILTAAPVGVAMMLGLLISLLQATTQVQEQTLTFVPKLVVVMIILAIAGPWSLNQLIAFTHGLIEAIPKYVK
jgi:flagellar biosynthesis protein FliQ